MTTADAFVTDERDPILEIVRAAQAGDSAAFEEIMILTERRVAQIAWGILGDAEEVKDAMQDTFLRLFRHLGRYDERRDFFAWLTRITVNVCLDTLRGRKRRRIFAPLDDAPPAVSGERPADLDLIRRDDLALLRQAIDSLPPQERTAILLKDVEGWSSEEVAAALGNRVTTVRVQLSRARVKLRQFIQRKRR